MICFSACVVKTLGIKLPIFQSTFLELNFEDFCSEKILRDVTIGDIMKILSFFFLLTILACSFAFGRSPAVEDFVGVEPESYREIKKGHEFAYDFSGEPGQVKAPDTSPSNLFSLFALAAFISLPLLMWLGMNQTGDGEVGHEGEANNVSFVDFQNKNSDNDKSLDEHDDIDKAS